MNYVPFTFVESIHAEKNKSLRTDARRHNDGFMPQRPLMPDPIGLLFSQIHSAVERRVARAIQVLFHAVPTGNEVGTSNLTVKPKRQPPASVVAQPAHGETIPTENEKNNGTGYDSRPMYA